MCRFLIAESAADCTSHAGLGIIGMALERYTNLASDVAAEPLRSDANTHRDILACYAAPLYLDKSDVEASSGFSGDAFFWAALGLEQVPLEGILRQAWPPTPMPVARRWSTRRWHRCFSAGACGPQRLRHVAHV
jgi:hypothetical protein